MMIVKIMKHDGTKLKHDFFFTFYLTKPEFFSKTVETIWVGFAVSPSKKDINKK